jgi:hypothetical protein
MIHRIASDTKMETRPRRASVYHVDVAMEERIELNTLYLVKAIVGFGSVLIVPPTVIIGTMLLMYRSVSSKIEQRMQNYGVNALRLKARSGGGNHSENAETYSARGATNDHHNGSMRRIKKCFMRMIPRCLHRDDQPPTSRSNRATSQKRAILHMATGYALASMGFRLYTFHDICLLSQF